MGTVRVHYTEALEELNQDLLSMGILVDESINKAKTALINYDLGLAEKVVKDDNKINAMEEEIEAKCTIILATEQPVAGDLRHILTVMKIATQMERIGDHAVHLAKAVKKIQNEVTVISMEDLSKMADIGSIMINDALTAFLKNSEKMARDTAGKDDEIDDLNRKLMREGIENMHNNTALISQGLTMLFVSRDLERIGDYITNICESIVYNATGKNVELN